MLDERHKVYAVKGVTAIPLGGFPQAISVTSAVARSNAAKARTSLVMSPSWNLSSDNTASESTDDVGNRVKFSEEPEIKVMSPVLDSDGGFPAIDRSPSPISVASVASSVSSELSAAPVAKVLASRLSFWSKSPKKHNVNTPDVESPRVSVDEEDDARPLDALIHEDMPEPQEVLNNIIETVAPSPATMSQKYTELEAKILRQTVKEFAKGEMYFAYDFGAPIHIPLKSLPITPLSDITHSLQHKQEQLAKTQKQNALLAELNALDISAQSAAPGEKVNVLSEPSPTHPLWHRVDRQFWWNEHLSKPFIDGKVPNRFISRNCVH